MAVLPPVRWSDHFIPKIIQTKREIFFGNHIVGWKKGGIDSWGYFLKVIPHRTTFASLARANERMPVHNERNVPRAKLDSEINVLFLLNEHGDILFIA